MIVVNWAEGVNQRILKGTIWACHVGVLADSTRCGAKKVRAGNTYAPAVYGITMHFTLAEKNLFMDWYENVCRHGVMAFRFPDIEKRTVEKVYRFSPDTDIVFSNPAGNIVEVQMQWETV